MINMEKEFVTYEIALKLKSIGFNLDCFAYFIIKDNGNVESHFLPANATAKEFGDLNQNNIANMVSRPLWQQMFSWFKNNYNFVHSIDKNNDNTWNWSFRINNSSATADSSGNVATELDAINAFIDRAIFKIQNPNALDESVAERSLRLISNYLESPESNLYFENLRIERETQEKRFKKFEKYLNSHYFPTLIDRLVKEHDEEYRDKCYRKGHEPLPNNKMQFLLDFVSSRGEKLKLGSVDDNMFESELYFYHDYYFQLSQGQGCFWRIFNKNKEEICTI